MGAQVKATNVGKKGHFKEDVTLGLLTEDGRRWRTRGSSSSGEAGEAEGQQIQRLMKVKGKIL